MPFNYNKPFTLDRVVRLIIAIAVLTGLYFLLHFLNDVLVPFVVAVLMAYFVNPLIEKVGNYFKLQRKWAVFLSLGMMGIVLFFVVLWMVGRLKREFRNLRDLLVNFADRTKDSHYVPEVVREYLATFASKKSIQALFDIKHTDEFLQEHWPDLWNLLSGSLVWGISLLVFMVVGLYFVFILLYYKRISEGWKELVPMAYRVRVVDFVNGFLMELHTYFRAQALVAFCVGVLCAIGFSIINLPMGIALGFFIGLLNMVPYLQIVGFLPAFLLCGLNALETGTSFWGMFGLVCLVIGIVQTIQDGFLVPKIMGKATGLNPVAILLSLSIWGKMLGFLGLLIALPLTSLLLSYYRQFIKNEPFNPHPEDNDESDKEDLSQAA